MGASACDWVEIGETASIGFLGLEWDVQTADVMDHCGGDPSEIYEKGVLRRPEIQLIMGNDPDDAGQALLWEAARSKDAYSFRLLFSDQVTERTWTALAIRMGEVFDAANNLIRLQVDLKPTSQVYPGEA